MVKCFYEGLNLQDRRMLGGKMNKRLSLIFRTFAAVILMAAFIMGSALLDDGTVYAAGGMAAPKLTKLQYYQTASGSYSAKIYWKSRKGATYQILRKTPGGKWKAVAQKKAKSTSCSYTNTKVGNHAYVYTVRQIKKKGKKIKSRGSYDAEGLQTMARPSVSVDFKTLNATVSWTKVNGAQKYLVYRKIGAGDSNQLIASVGANVTSYTDVYQKSYKNKKMDAILVADYFVDPSNNPISYTVRPYYGKKNPDGSTKGSYGLYVRDGICHLEPPTVVSLSDKGVIKWGTVPNADGYIVVTKSGNGDWTKVVNVAAEKSRGVYQSTTIKKLNKNNYYSVRAYMTRNGKKTYTTFDKNFTLKNRSVGAGKKVLFLGDSMTFGSPYYSKSVHSFSYASRIQQLTGIKMFNPSIPGSTWRYHPLDNRYRIVTGVANMIALGQNTDYAFETLQIGGNSSKFEDYDVVVLAAGTNDYQDKTETPFGSRESDWEKITDKTEDLSFTVNAGTKYSKKYSNMDYDYNIETFDGAYNQILKYIEEASMIRVLNGKAPIKVVPISLFYSERTSPYYEVNNRNITKNKLGYTMLDYQAEMDAINAEWAKSPVLEFYRYDSQATNIVNSENCRHRASDNLHYSKYTYGLYGDDIARFMINNKILSSPSAATITAIRESDAFKARLAKYSRLRSFTGKLSAKLTDLMSRLIGADEEPEEVVTEEPVVETPAEEEPTDNTEVVTPEEPAADSGQNTEQPAEGGTPESGSTEAEPQTETPAADQPAPSEGTATDPVQDAGN